MEKKEVHHGAPNMDNISAIEKIPKDYISVA